LRELPFTPRRCPCRLSASMIFNRSNSKAHFLKKGAALLAIALVLGSSLQQVHAFCLLSEVPTADGLATTPSEAGSTCCCHSHHASKSDSACGLASTPDQPHSPPCDDNNCQHCWCCQAPLSRIVTTDTKSLLKYSDFFTLHTASSALASPTASTPFAGTVSTGGNRSLSALQRCAHLCRFLA
jgi:hypothetical protein